ncbi:hypothetical protein Goklo_025855 [Gossypium klotzschianum]|uniref:Uncharacterized protein n=1 Tax=Gossypium klotzschianum TaxID=34286 RepID=A0A7J8TT18_9ROSI|nr:hypothetical protein [Gossypium klotzschianum]
MYGEGGCVYGGADVARTEETAEALPLNKNVVVSVEQREPTPAVSFRNKDHEMVDEERLFALHLAKIDRILQSVPSPGAGH